MNAETPSTAGSSSPPASRGGKSRSRRRAWLFRLGAVLLGLSVFGVAEAVCWCFDWGRPSHADDPFAGFREIYPLFELDERGERYEIPPARLNFFAKESFPAQKGDRTFRIFCLGESTVQGRPYSKETSFTTFLELALVEADPRRDWDVINCGGISYASYRLAPILQECLSHQPDLFILCVGHNEFLEDRTYGHIKQAPKILAVPQQVLGGLRTFTLVRQLVLGATGQSTADQPKHRPQLGGEVDPILDYHDSLKAYHRDPEWRAGVIAHYESNVARMVAISRSAGVPMLVVLQPSNLGDCVPFKSEHRGDLSPAEQKRFAALMTKAQGLYREDVSQAVRVLKEALALDDQHAAAWYELGQCYRALGLSAQAREALVRARDEDICPLRMITPLEEALRRVVQAENVPFLDAHELLERECRGGILDGTWLVDHVHPSFEGHQKIADALVRKLAESEQVELSERWQHRAKAAHQKHLESLDAFYFLKGQRTLEAVQGWTQGQADGPPAADRFPHLIRAQRSEAGGQ